MRVFPLWMAVWQQSHPIFPPGSHGATELHLFLWHWQCGFERKIPMLSGMLNCWVPESENILPAVNVRKTEQPWLKCQVVFWKANSPENKGYWYPAKRAGRNRPWARHWNFGGAWNIVCLFVSASDFWIKRWATQNVRNGSQIDKIWIIFLAIFRAVQDRDSPFWLQ